MSDFGFQGGGGSGYVPPSSLNYGLFSQISPSIPVGNLIQNGSLVGLGLGTLTVPANTFNIGDSFQANMMGHLSSKNNENFTIDVWSNGVGTTLLGSTGPIKLPTTTSKHFELNLFFTIRALGISGGAEICSSCSFTYSKDASNSFEGANFVVINNTSFDTTIANTLDIDVSFASVSVLNQIYSDYFTLVKLF